EYFVDLFGYTPFEVLMAATRDGGRAADPTGMVGTLEPGKYADIVVVDGDPLTDITVLQRHDRISAVIKGGQPYVGLTNNNPYAALPKSLDPVEAPEIPHSREPEIERVGALG